jgi:acyl carrier protein
VAVVKPAYLAFMFDFYPKPYPGWLGVVLEHIERNEVRTVSTLVTELAQLEQTERYARLTDVVASAVRTVLGITHTPDASLGFFEMGMDSLMAVSLREQLQTRLGLQLSATLGFDYPSIEKLSQYLLEQLKLDEQELSKEIDSNSYLSKVNHLSDEAVNNYLDNLLK